jgi:carbonic anhydrase
MKHFADLIDGYRRFRETAWTRERERWAELAHGQNPKVMVIACSDSRVDPAQIFDVHPGEIFVVRNVANLAPPFNEGGGLHGVSAALEFAVTQLEVEEILVLGHGYCGGCAAGLTRQFQGAEHGAGHFIGAWVALLDGARDKVRKQHSGLGRDAFLAMELEAVKLSLSNLRTFPWIAEREQAGTLSLHGGHFAIDDGQLHLLDDESGEFAPA